MDPRKGKANYGEAFRQNFISSLSENQNSKSLHQNIHHIQQKGTQQQISKPQNNLEKFDNFRIVNDPYIKAGCKLLFSINGVIPGKTETVVMIDPRSRLNKLCVKKQVSDLPVPKFKYDTNSVGNILPKEVSFFNLNNNIDKEFLISLCKPFGSVEEATIWSTSAKQHNGIGSVMFFSTKSAQLCCEKLNNTPAMGKIMVVVIDTHGELRKKKLLELQLNEQQKLIDQNKKTQPQASNFKSPSQINRTPIINNIDVRIPSQSNQPSQHPLIKPSSSNQNQNKPLQQDSYTPTTPITNPTTNTPSTQHTPSYSDQGYSSCKHSETSGGDSVSSNNSCGSINNSVISKNSINKYYDNSTNNNDHSFAHNYDKKINGSDKVISKDKDGKSYNGEISINKTSYSPSNDKFTEIKDKSSHRHHKEYYKYANLSEECNEVYQRGRSHKSRRDYDEEKPGKRRKSSNRSDHFDEEYEYQREENYFYRSEYEMEYDRPYLNSSRSFDYYGSKTKFFNDYFDTYDKRFKFDEPSYTLEGRKYDGKKRKRSKERHWKRKKYDYEDYDKQRSHSSRKHCRKCQDYGVKYCKEHRKRKRSRSHDKSNSKSNIIIIDDDEDEAETGENIEKKSLKLTSHIEKEKEVKIFDDCDNKINKDPSISRQDSCSNIVSQTDDKDRAVSLESRIQALLNTERNSDNKCTSKNGEEDDKMSISSGGGDEHHIEVNNVDHKKVTSNDSKTSQASNHNSIHPYNSSQNNNAQTYPYNFPYHHTYPHMPPYHSFYHHQSYFPPLFMPRPPIHSYNPNYHNSSNMCSLYKNNMKDIQSISNNDDKDLSERPEFKAVLQAITMDLQVAVSKDLRKKITENLAYKLFDDWWDENSENDPSLLLKKNLQKNPIKSSAHQNGSLLGFRGAIALMPSFRKKRKTPTPPLSEEEKRKSESSHEEESDKEEGSAYSGTNVPSSDEDADAKERSQDFDSDVNEDSKNNNVLNKKKKRRRIMESDDELIREIKDKKSFESSSSGEESDDEGSETRSAEKKGRKVYSMDSPIDSKPHCRVFYPKESAKPKDFHSEKKASSVFKKHGNILNNNLQPMVLLNDVTNKFTNNYSDNYLSTKKSRELLRLQCSLTPAYLSVSNKSISVKKSFVARSFEDESAILASFVNLGMDEEDSRYLKKSYEQLLSADYPETFWLNETHWADHPLTAISTLQSTQGRKGRRKEVKEELDSVHQSGSARTEGYYKISGLDKMKYLKATVCLPGLNEEKEKEAPKQDNKSKVQNMSRHARSESRRLQTLLGEDYGDVMKINRLKFRKKDLKFGKSFIHDWGLYAREKIQEGELIIEYVGEVIRPSMADIREKRYEKSGIGSSYLFRIDSDTIIDATKTGNMARFINHSCNPNCSVKIITVDSLKKIVIYSKRDIEINDEITFDYKFPIEEEKIPCRCGAFNCRGTLN